MTGVQTCALPIYLAWFTDSYSKHIKYLCISYKILDLILLKHKHISFHKIEVDCLPSGCSHISLTWTAGGRHKPSGRPYVERQLHVALMPWPPDGERMHLMKSCDLMFWSAHDYKLKCTYTLCSYYKLNEKDKLKSDIDERPGKRTILKLKLYKHINAKIREIYPDFNIGISTPIKEESDRWFQVYRHWSFKPKHHTRDLTRTKRAKK